MEDYIDNHTWDNAGGYGFWCGRSCAERKRAAGIRPRFSKSAQADFDAEQERKAQAEQQRQMMLIQQAQQQAGGGGGSKTGIIIAGVLGLAVVGGLMFYAMRK
jgi:hypothetical protein